MKQLQERLKLDRRRFEAAHLKYAVLMVSSRYPEIDKPVTMYSDLQRTLKLFTPNFYKAFETKYSGKLGLESATAC